MIFARTWLPMQEFLPPDAYDGYQSVMEAVGGLPEKA